MPDILTSIHGRRLGLEDTGSVLTEWGRSLNRNGMLFYNSAAASTALSNFTSQRAFDTYATIPANSLRPGNLIRIKYQGIQTAVNGTDTMQPILSIGVSLGASLAVTGGTALLTSTATTGAANLVFTGEYDLTIRTIGSSGTMVGNGWFKKAPAAEAAGTTMVDDILASTTIDTTAAQIICVGLVYSAASASNSVRLDRMSVFIN